MSIGFELATLTTVVLVGLRAVTQIPSWWRNPSQSKSFKVWSSFYSFGMTCLATLLLMAGVILLKAEYYIYALFLLALSIAIFVLGIRHVNRWKKEDGIRVKNKRPGANAP